MKENRDADLEKFIAKVQETKRKVKKKDLPEDHQRILRYMYGLISSNRKMKYPDFNGRIKVWEIEIYSNRIVIATVFRLSKNIKVFPMTSNLVKTIEAEMLQIGGFIEKRKNDPEKYDIFI